MRASKLSSTHSTSRLSSSRKPSLNNTLFRTINKRRNETIPEPQLYQRTPIHRPPTSMSRSAVTSPGSRPHTQSQLIDTPTLNPASESKMVTTGIKDYVKRMVQKKEEVRTQRIDSGVVRQQSVTRSAVKSIINGSVQPTRSIEELEKKIQAMLAQNLDRFQKQKPSNGVLQQSNYLHLGKDLEELINYFTQLKVTIGSEEQQKLDQMNRRIEALEKMLASESLQSEMLKSQYYSWKSQRGNTSSLNVRKSAHNKHTTRYNFRETQQFHKHVYSEGKRGRSIIGQYSSISQTSFKKPPPESYHHKKEKKKFIAPNRQPLPRSNYSAQYLNYGIVPTRSCKPQGIRLTQAVSSIYRNSSYQQQFKDKTGLAHNICGKDLDCAKDKIKTSDLSFTKTSKKGYFESLASIKRRPNVKQNRQNTKVSHSDTLGSFSLNTSMPFLKSEHQKEFVWHNTVVATPEETPIRSQIKDKKLDRLKNTYKALAMRQ